MNWYFKKDEHTITPLNDISQVPEGAIGFVYMIRWNEDPLARDRSTDKWYIGKKSLYSHRTLPPLKGMKRKRKVVKESDWLNYNSSSKVVKEWNEPWKQILQFAYTKKELTYLETKLLFALDALEDPNCVNDNILGKFFRGEHDQ